MMYEELYEMTDDELLYKTQIYLRQIRANIAEEEKTKDEILSLLDKTIFYLDFHNEVNKIGLDNLDEKGKELKKLWDTHQI